MDNRAVQVQGPQGRSIRESFFTWLRHFNNGDRRLAEQQASEARRKRMERSIDNMRGWALTVATLLVGMAFQAALSPPSWLPPPRHWFDALFGGHAMRSSFTMAQARNALAHFIFNTVTFSLALTLVLLLMIPKEWAQGRNIVQLIGITIVLLTLSVAGNFATLVSDDPRVMGMALGIIGFIAIGAAVIYFLTGSPLPPLESANQPNEEQPNGHQDNSEAAGASDGT